VSKDYVLTAAHCLAECVDAPVDLSRYRIVVGKALMSEARDVQAISPINSYTVTTSLASISTIIDVL